MLTRIANMSNMIRTIHPVGCGLFVTEYFRFSEKMVVYDCGRGKQLKERDFFRLVDAALSPTRHIDYLFISHFDADHINGIEYLIKQQYINNRTNVYLPLVSRQQVQIYEDVLGMWHFREIFHLLLESKVTLIPIRPEESVENQFDWNPVEELRSLNTAGSGEIITFDKFWEYIPLYIQEDIVSNEFKDFLIKRKFPIEKLYAFQQMDEEERSLLKQAYQDFKGGENYHNRKMAPTPINMNAMMLISKPVEELFNNVFSLFYHRFRHQDNFPHYGLVNNASCVYTSDVGLAESQFLDRMVMQVKKILPNEIGLFQIPHHGSYKCYTKEIYSRLRINAIFINGDTHSTNPALCADIVDDAWQYHIPFAIVDVIHALQQYFVW